MLNDNPLLDVKNVSASHMELNILDRTNLQVNAHDIVCLLGPSGCGKTTLLRSIAGLHKIDQGSIAVDNKVISTSHSSLAPEARNIGMMFQDLALFPHLTIFDNVAFGIRKLQKTYVQQQVEHVLDLVEIESKHHRKYPHELSGGQQQRVAIARALAGEPRFLLADEPTGNLDSHMAMSVMELIADINQGGTTIIMVTHDPMLAEMASRNVHILDGRVSNGDAETPFSQVAAA